MVVLGFQSNAVQNSLSQHLLFQWREQRGKPTLRSSEEAAQEAIAEIDMCSGFGKVVIGM